MPLNARKTLIFDALDHMGFDPHRSAAVNLDEHFAGGVILNGTDRDAIDELALAAGVPTYDMNSLIGQFVAYFDALIN